MLSGPLVSYVSVLYNIRWIFVIFSILLLLYILYKIIKKENIFNKLYCTNDYIEIIIITIFLFYCIIISLFSDVYLKNLIIALKNNFQFYPLIFLYFIMPFCNRFSVNLIKSVMIIAFIQLPISIAQYIFVVPIVKSDAVSKSTGVLDAVNGTFGTSLKGGGTGVLVFFSCIVLCGLLLAVSRKMISRWKWLISSIVVISPMLINETKASFAFFMVGVFVIVIFDNKIKTINKLKLFTISTAMVVLLLGATFSIYSMYGYSPEQVVKDTISYNFGSKGYGKYRLNRFSSLTFWWDKNKDDLVTLFLGHGLDSTNEGTSGLSDIGSVAQRYPLYGTGLTTASQMLWEVGVLGSLLFLSVFVVCFCTCFKLSRLKDILILDSYLAILNLANLSMLLLLLFYNSSFRDSQPANLIIYVIILLTLHLKSKNMSHGFSGKLTNNQ